MRISTLILTGVAGIALAAGAANAQTTVVKKTYVTPAAPATMDSSQFDVNGDKILTIEEVGNVLFDAFDNDGNDVLDNIEMENPKILTLRPVKVEEYTFVDLNSDGTAEQTQYNYETFMTQSMLARFDGDKDGLSPKEFIGHSFLEMDTDNSKTIELDEWRKTYIAKVRKHNDPDSYNR